MADSHLERLLALQLRAAGIEGWLREHQFLAGRKFRFDFAWPAEKLAVECEGGSWIGGRHNRGVGFASDCAKYNLAVVEGNWRVLRFPGDQIESGEALRMIERALGITR